jgi:hypothetical protein
MSSERPVPWGPAGLCHTGTVPRYVNNTTLGSRVASLNPRWNQPTDDATLYKQVM